MQKNSKIIGLMGLITFAVFAVSILLVLLMGADGYKRLARTGQLEYDHRTALQYVTTRVRQADESGGLGIESFDGVDALVFPEEIDGELYETRVYCCDGYLCELFTLAGGDFSPEDGEQILPVSRLSLDWEAPLLSVHLTFADGFSQELTLTLRSGEAG